MLAPVSGGITHSRYIPDKSTLATALVCFKSLFVLFDFKHATELKLMGLQCIALSTLQEHLSASAALKRQKRSTAIE